MRSSRLTQARVTTKDLEAALEPAGKRIKYITFHRYSKQKPTVDAIPLLRRALADDYFAVVRCAAHSLKKLGPAAIEAMDDLWAAAMKVNEPFSLPQSYCECLEAMVAINPSHPAIIPLIKQFVGSDNWGPISVSLRALKAIGTPEAIELLHRMAAFWTPDLNKMQRRVVEKLVQPD